MGVSKEDSVDEMMKLQDIQLLIEEYSNYGCKEHAESDRSTMGVSEEESVDEMMKLQEDIQLLVEEYSNYGCKEDDELRRLEMKLQVADQQYKMGVSEEESLDETMKLQEDIQLLIEEYSNYGCKEDDELRRIEMELLRNRVGNLGEELASIIKGGNQPDFLSPWFAISSPN